MSLAIEDYVVRFEVAEDDHIFVEGLESENELADVLAGLLLGDCTLFADEFAQITAGVVVHHQEEFGT